MSDNFQRPEDYCKSLTQPTFAIEVVYGQPQISCLSCEFSSAISLPDPGAQQQIQCPACAVRYDAPPETGEIVEVTCPSCGICTQLEPTASMGILQCPQCGATGLVDAAKIFGGGR